LLLGVPSIVYHEVKERDGSLELYQMSALQISEQLSKRNISAEEVVNYFWKRTQKLEPELKSFITTCPEDALEVARKVDELRRQGEELHPFAGIPVAVKDNLSTRGMLTTCGSQILENYYPPYDASVIQKLRDNHLPVMGKTNMDEFGMGSSTENSAFFPTTNPWNHLKVPGGSSGGSAAAVASRQVPLALGSDTGGSVRQPAAFCGVYGLRPTYGRVSRYGLIAFASSLDQVGPITGTPEDGEMLFDLIAGFDERDATSLVSPGESPAPEVTEEQIKNLRVGVIREQGGDGFAAEVVESVKEMASFWESCGAAVEEVSLPLTDYALAAYYLLNSAEASSNLGRYDGIRYGYSSGEATDIKELFFTNREEGFGPEVKRRIVLGTYALSSGYYDDYYLKALKTRTLILRDMKQALQAYDLLLGPTTPTPPFSLGEKVEDPLQMYLSDVCTITDPLVGNTVISVPGGFTSEGMPLGLQMSAAPFRESFLFKLACFWQRQKQHLTCSTGTLRGNG